MDYNEGDIVVAPGCGVGVVEEIENVDLGDAPVEMYRIRSRTTGVRMWVPVVRAQLDGLRRPMSPEVVDDVLRIIGATEAPETRATWNRRQRRYRELLQSNRRSQLVSARRLPGM